MEKSTNGTLQNKRKKRTSSLSTTSVRSRPRHCATVSCNSGAYSLFCTALRMSEGLVVASCGWNAANCLKSPVSATTVVNALSASSWFMRGDYPRPRSAFSGA